MIHTKTEERTISMLKRFYNISIRTNTIGNLRRFNSGTMAEAQDNNTGPSFPITQIINEKILDKFKLTLQTKTNEKKEVTNRPEPYNFYNKMDEY